MPEGTKVDMTQYTGLQQSDYFNPSTDQRSNTALSSLWDFVTPLLDDMPQEHQQKVMQVASNLVTLIQKGRKAGAEKRIAVLNIELEQVREKGRKAQAAVLEAKANELAVRNEDNARTNAFNKAGRSLKAAQDEPLPQFYGQEDVKRRNETVASAQRQLDSARASLDANPLAVPMAVQRVKEAQRELSNLIDREKSIRTELASLSGESTPNVGNVVSSGIGL